jgi:predicted AAA+ superfamily ATPase
MLYLFVDEAHYDPLWSRALKQYVDQQLPIYAIVSGSSAEAVYMGQESGAGRFHMHQMVTMKYRDILRLRDGKNDAEYTRVSKKLREGLLASFKNRSLTEYNAETKKAISLGTAQLDVIRKCYSEYLLKGGYPEFYQHEWVKASRYYQANVFDVILAKDIVRVSKPRMPEKVRTLLVLIAENTARSMNREKIATRLGLQSLTADQYLEALTIAFLARTSVKFRKSGGYPSTSPKKYYIADTGLRNAVLGVENIESTVEEGALLETAIFNHSLRLMFHVDRQIRTQGNYWLGKGEMDIVLDLKKLNIAVPIEVKNGNCGDEDIKKMKIAIKELGAPFGFIICSDKIGVVDNIMMIPPWLFMLSC